MASSEKKRPLIEENTNETVSSIPSRPPLKKRFTSSMNVQQVTSQANTLPAIHTPTTAATATATTATATTATATTTTTTTTTTTAIATSSTSTSDTPMEPLGRIDKFPMANIEFPIDSSTFTKDALLTHMRSAKEEANYLEQKHDALEQTFINKEATQSLLRIEWNLIQSEILFMAKILVNLDLPEPSVPLSTKMTLEEQKDWCYNSLLTIKELGTKALTRLESWSKHAELIERRFRLEDDIMLKRVIVSDWLKNEIVDLEQCYKRGELVMTELQQRLQHLEDETRAAEGNVVLAKEQLAETTEKLENCIQELSAVCRRRDRAKSKTVAALTMGGLGGMTDSGPSTATDDQPASSSVKKEKQETTLEGPAEEQSVKTQLEEHRLILSAREKEIDDLKKDRQNLLQDEDRLLSMFKLSEERLLETEYVKTLQLSIDHYKNRCHDLEQKRVELERELDKMSAARKQLIEQVKSEKVSQGMTMESEIRRMEGDLNRIRGQRDSFQSLVEEQKIKESREKEGYDKIISFATQGKTRIASLESRIDKLKNDQEMAGPFEKEANTYNNLKKQLSHMEILLSSLQLMEKKETQESHFDIKAMQQALEKWSSHSLVKQYDQIYEDSQKSALMVDFLEKNESHLLEEIDRVASIYGKLEEQQSKKVFDFAQKRDQMLKLQAEILKYAQTFGSLLSAKEKQMSTVLSLKATREKQQELIKQLEEKEKNLEIQVIEKENELRKLNRNIEEDRIDLEDISHVCDDYRVTIDQNEILLVELQKMLKDKMKLMEEEKQLQEEIRENYEKMKKKWEKMSQGDNSAEQQLAEECDELRALLKCNTCRTRFRSHILIRCMHTFCKSCIDARLETRQRRCPTCSEPFGANDVRSFYL